MKDFAQAEHHLKNYFAVNSHGAAKDPEQYREALGYSCQLQDGDTSDGLFDKIMLLPKEVYKKQPKDFRILIACEESGTVRDAFAKLGFDATSCDLFESRTPGKHHQGNIFDIIDDGWDLMIAFPPCTHLAVSGAKHFEQKRKDGRQQEGIDFFIKLAMCPVPLKVIENPVGIMSTVWRKPDQVVQPWQFGDKAQKTTCLWLEGLPPLKHTNIVEKGEFYITPGGKKMPSWMCDPVGENGKKLAYGSAEIKKLRSKTFQGIADAMAKQYGDFLLSQP